MDLLCARLNGRDITRACFAEKCVKLTRHHAACSRASLWVFGDSPHGRLLRWEGLYNRTHDRMVQVADESKTKSNPCRLERERTGHVLADDARPHPATRGFFEDHLAATGVRSFMAAAFSLNGRLFGTFTCTQVDESRKWSQRQLAALTKIGCRATLALTGGPRSLASMIASL